MIERSVKAALFEVVIGLRGVGDERADAEEVVPGAAQVVEPDVGMGLLVKDLRDVGFALEAAIEVRRGEGGGAQFDEAEAVGGGGLQAEAKDVAQPEAADDRLD